MSQPLFLIESGLFICYNFNMEIDHKQSIYNAKELKKHKQCGCFFCVNVQESKDVTEFCDDGDTGLCPRCSVDSLLPNVVDLDLLAEMHEKWFCQTTVL